MQLIVLLQNIMSIILDTNVELPGFSTVRTDRDTKACGKVEDSTLM